MPAPAGAPTPGGFDLAGASVYLIGIGGCGMSGLARMLRGRGALVAGSDASASALTESLALDGIPVGLDQTRLPLPERCDLVVASAAIKPDNPQLVEAGRRGLPVLTYAQALGRCMLGTTAVTVAGTHGKSTTTAMLGVALADAGLDPTVIVGATCPQLGGGFRLGARAVPLGPLRGQPGLLLAEACEFNRSFHSYHPTVAAITSVEADHLDIYGSLDAVVEAFHVFAKLLPPADRGGLLLIAEQGAHRREVTAGLDCAVQTIGFAPSADWSVRFEPETHRTALVRRGEGLVAAWTSPLPGAHNAMNAATACALAVLTGADPDKAARSIASFRGLKRRTEFLGTRPLRAGGSVRVYDDYGHHPTEVGTTLRALRDFERPEQRGGRLICVFQPHQHSRTRHLMEEFASAFEAADLVIVPHIYFVRDSIAEKHMVSAADLVDRLRAKGVQAMHLYPFEAIVDQLGIVCRDGDLLVVMGAGPVDQVATGFLAAAPAPR
ncbi:MAG TPA: UDP-N-acetylmuramate--L-alanine ligase [Phycisphaerales bacterium]|nr:UDP-N-acetylmuramate--L-alanine ligase [Phycisphaerales bacterium]